jgi:hypothetical protein
MGPLDRDVIAFYAFIIGFLVCGMIDGGFHIL